MKLDINFSALETLVKNMGASSSFIWESGVVVTKVENDWKIRLAEGKEVIPIDEIEISPEGFVKYKGEQILLHIKDFNLFYSGRRASFPKFHFQQCTTLDSMLKQGRFKRYVATQRKDGFFLIDKISEGGAEHDVETKLDACQNCLKKYNQLFQKKHSVGSFDIPEFFEQFGQSEFTTTPIYSDNNAPMSGWTSDWDEVSKSCKEQCHYICQECNLDLNFYKKLLHTHHINGVKNDNSQSNLKVLCAECHSNQAMHAHMKSGFSRDILEIQQIRKL